MTQDIYELLAQEESGADEAFKVKESRAQFVNIQYKVLNSKPGDPAPDKSGIVKTKSAKADGKKQILSSDLVDEVRAVILYTSDSRLLYTTKVVCCSDDGYTPSGRIESPMCKRATAQDVAEVLSKFKGYDQARITSVTQELTQDTGKLCHCSIQTNNGFIPICPASRYDDMGRPPACKQQVFVAAWDIDAECLFYMTLTGLSIRNDRKFKSPFHCFRDFLAKKKVPAYCIEVTLSAAKAERSYVLDVQNFTPVADAAKRGEFKKMAEAELERYVRRACQGPEGKAPDSLPKRELPENIGVNAAVQEVLPEVEEDDIPF